MNLEKDRIEMPLVKSETRRRVIFSVHEDPLSHYQKIRPKMLLKDPIVIEWIDMSLQYWSQVPAADSAFISGSVLVWEILHAEEPNLPSIEIETLQSFIAEQAERFRIRSANPTADQSEAFTTTSPRHLHDPLSRIEENPELFDLIERMERGFSEKTEPAFIAGAMSVYELIKRRLEAFHQKPN